MAAERVENEEGNAENPNIAGAKCIILFRCAVGSGDNNWKNKVKMICLFASKMTISMQCQ